MSEEALTAEESAYLETRGAAAEPTAKEQRKPGAEPAGIAEPQKPEQKPEQPETGGDDKIRVKEEKVVPLAALHEERAARKKLQQDQTELRRQLDVGNQRLAKLLEAQAKAEEPQVPNRDEDPVAYFEHKTQAQEKELAEFRRWQQAEEQASAQTRAINAIASQAAAQESEFVRENADYYDAVNHLRAARDVELQEIGVEDPATRLQVIQRETLGLMHSAFQAGRNVAEVAYKLAKARGYAKSAAEAEKLARIAEGQQASKSLSSAGGAAPNPKAPTLQALAAMSEDDFAEAVKDRRSFRKLMGG